MEVNELSEEKFKITVVKMFSELWKTGLNKMRISTERKYIFLFKKRDFVIKECNN